MNRLLHITDPSQLREIRGLSGVPPISDEAFGRQSPDLHIALVAAGGPLQELTARCSIWWTGCAETPGERVGYVGHFAATTADASDAVLADACQSLGARGCTLAAGPIDGNTWRSYRFIVERGEEPPFFLEPDNPDEYPEYFARAGFEPLATFTSALNQDLSRSDPRMAETAARLQQTRVRIRHFDASQARDELRRIYRMSVVSFSGNFLYTPIDEATFLAMYEPVLSIVRAETILIAEQNGEDVGFLFAVPDMLQARGPLDTLIVKTVAVVPDRARTGLGGLLVHRCQIAAHELGFRRCIHALMHEANMSRRISNRYAHTIRRYALFQKRLP